MFALDTGDIPIELQSTSYGDAVVEAYELLEDWAYTLYHDPWNPPEDGYVTVTGDLLYYPPDRLGGSLATLTVTYDGAVNTDYQHVDYWKFHDDIVRREAARAVDELLMAAAALNAIHKSLR